MTYLLIYLTTSPLLALAHIANIYLHEYRADRRAEKRRRDEVLMLEILWQSSERPRV